MSRQDDPCHCGSGNKYKDCCFDRDRTLDPSEFDEELIDLDEERGIPQLLAFAPQWMPEETASFFDAVLDDEVREGLSWLAKSRPEALADLMGGVHECLLADLARRGLADRFPHRMSPGQIAYVKNLAVKPLRFWEVQSVLPGEYVGLVPLNSPNAELTEVFDEYVSGHILLLEVIAARVVEDSLEPNFSSIFPVDRKEARALLAKYRPATRNVAAKHEADIAVEIAFLRENIRRVAIPPKIQLLEGGGGQVVAELVCDRFQVLDRLELRKALSNIYDLESASELQTEWNRFVALETGVIRNLAKLRLVGDFLVMESGNRPAATSNRKWLRDRVGDLLQHRSSKIAKVSDEPKRETATGTNPERSPLPMTPDVIDAVYRSTYREWPDTPIPVLDHKSPRQCAKTVKGRKAVRDWVQECQLNENRMAQFQRRDPVDLSWLLTTVGMDANEL